MRHGETAPQLVGPTSPHLFSQAFERMVLGVARSGTSPSLAQELRTHLGDRKAGHLFETRAARAYSPRRVQQLVKEIDDRRCSSSSRSR